MLKKATFQLVASPDAITEPVTKFGGQPFWMGPSHWPRSPESGAQMCFFGQVALPEELFPASADTLVYLFFSAESEPLASESFTAVVQRGTDVYLSADPTVVFGAEAQGPTLFEQDEAGRATAREYRAILGPVEVEGAIPLDERYTFNDLDYASGFTFAHPELAGNKIGGQALYIGQLSDPPEPFDAEGWRLLLQLAPRQGYYGDGFQPNFYPFAMELGEFGILSAFISDDYTHVVCVVEQP